MTRAKTIIVAEADHCTSPGELLATSCTRPSSRQEYKQVSILTLAFFCFSSLSQIPKSYNENVIYRLSWSRKRIAKQNSNFKTVSGHAYSEDLNGYRQEGVGWFDMTIKNGKRWSAAEAYLRPALLR